MSDLERHVEAAARWALWNAFERWTEEGWEAMPDITEQDYESVVAAAEKLLPADVTFDEFDVAYRFLEGRTDAEG